MKHTSKKAWWIALICVAVLAATAVTVLLMPRGAGGTDNAAFTRTGDEAGVTVETGLSPDSFRNDPAVTAWLAKCDSPDRDDQDAYALRYTDTAPNGTVTCTWLIYRRQTDTPAGLPTVTLSEARDGQLTLTVTYTPGETVPGNLCRLSGQFDSVPDLELDGTLGLIISVTNTPF